MQDSVSVAGYSGTPLATKLGVKEESNFVLLHGPSNLELSLPTSVTIAREARRGDVVLAFFTRQADLARELESLGSLVFATGSLWLAWPKKASRMETDLSDNAVRDDALRIGLVDNKVCAIDATWSGLRLVWRKEMRTKPHTGQAPD